MTVNQFYKYQKTSVVVSVLILMSILIHPACHLIDLALNMDAIEMVELNDLTDSSKETENSEFEENPLEKKNQIEDSLDWTIYFNEFFNPIKLQHPQSHDPIVMDIVLPPPEQNI